MIDGDKLININLQIEYNKADLNPFKGFKLYLLEALYSIQKFKGRYKFWDILFTIFEFIQLMAFPMDQIFDDSYGNHWIKTIGKFFRFTQLIFLWKGTSFFIITYIFVCLYIILFLSLFFYIVIKSISSASENIIKFFVLILQIQTILNIPFLKTLFSIFFCKNDILEVSPQIKCKSGIHVFLICISAMFIIVYKLIIIIFHSTLYEFGVQSNKLKSGYSSSTEVLLNLTKLILIIVFQFISHQMILAIISLIFSLLLLIHFLIKQPYSNGFTMKLYLSLYALFCWSNIICFISILLKNSNFRSRIVLLILGYPLILIGIYLQEWDFSFDKYFSLYLSNSRGGYNCLLSIEYFLKLEDSLAEKVKTREFKLLFSYIADYESKCIEPNCHLKSFMKIQFKPENFKSLRILLLKHAELLYKKAITKYPNDIKLRIGYVLFLFKKLNKRLKAKNEIILLNKFETNFENNFLIYKLQKYSNDIIKEEESNELNNNENLCPSMTTKKISKEIKSLLENIVNNYISFWNILLTHEWNKTEYFDKMNHLGKDIKYLNKELNKKIKTLDSWNLIDQDTIKIYIKYLKEIINNNEKAEKYNIRITEEEHNKHQYDELNLYELNYKELSKNEDYKYIVIDLSKNEISNVSYPICKIFGYTKEELIDRPLDILFPEIYNTDRKLFFQNRIKDYKQKLLINNKKINTETWIDNTFGIDKNNYLIPIKFKWFITSLEDEKVFIIGNIFLENKKLYNDKKQEIVYILTDRNLFIQNFTSNAPKILCFNSYISIINYNISNFISELNENLINEFEIKNEKETSNIKNNSRSSKRITRYIKSDILKKYNYLGQNSIRIIHWKTYETVKGNNNYKNSIHENSNYNISSLSIKSPKIDKSSENLIFLEKTKKRINDENIRNTASIMNKGINWTNNYNIEMNKVIYSKEVKTIENNNNLLKQKEKMFNMLVKEAKFNDHKVGYIFIFKSFINIEGENNKNENDGIKDLISSQEMNNMNISDISLISFGDDKKKLNNLQTSFEYFNIDPKNNDIFFQNFFCQKENQFTFDINGMAYRQFKFNEKNSFYEEIKEKAIQKLTNIKNQFQNEESEEEEDSSEYDHTSEEDNSNNSFDSSKLNDEKQISLNDENKIINGEIKNNIIAKKSILITKKTLSSKNIITDNSGQNIINKKKEEINKIKEEENFYHVNFNKITFLVYNYSSGFAEIQKNQNNKISQVTYIINGEKEKYKNISSKYLANTKFMKGRKKGNINKKEEENEVNTYNNTSMKLKEIYRILSSKKVEKSILKMLLFSFIIFILIIGTGILNTLIYSYLKNSIYTIFLLIQKSDNLYQNLLFEISLVKEMLIANNSYYSNTLNNNKTLYYQGLSKMIYHYYTENFFIISNLTNHFNILNKEDEESITQKQIELYIIDPIKSSKFIFQYKKYSILIYSAYRELNSALYHISQLKMEEIYNYDNDVYYFLKNGMSNLLISSERQMWTLTEKLKEKIKSGHNIIIICCISIFFVYCFCMFIFSYFYKNIILKRNNYLSILNEIDTHLIISSLQKCENFFQKLQQKNQNKEVTKRKISLDSSSEKNSEIENDNSSLIEKKNKEENIIKERINTNEKNKKSKNNYIYQIILFLIFLAWQIGIYIYYYQKMTLYQNIATYEYYISMYASNFLFIFISLREYAFDKKFMFYNKTVDEYVDTTLENYYVIFSQSSKLKDIYRVYFPDSYQKFLNYLYNGKICEFINNYIHDYPDTDINCDNFFYCSSKFGFFTIIATFIEEARMLRDKIDIYYEIADQKNFTYNESLFNEPNGNYENFYKQYENNNDEYRQYNPANIFRTDSHKKLLITYLYINTQVYSFLISESLNQFEQVFKKYNSINLILNLIFIIFVALGFIFIWIPFLSYVNKTFGKIKNSIYIIPGELLINIQSINNLFGIE